jgi:hypothetical protein
MNAIPRLVWASILLLVPAGYARAQAPAPELLRGKVLLLDNDRILEGEIERVDGQYRVRRGVGVTWVPVNRVKRLCKDLDDTYEVMKKQINVRDADERLRLARWCQLNGLKDHALLEGKAALEMRPDHAETLNLVQTLQRFAISSSPALATQHPPAPPAIKPPVVKQTLDVSTEAFAQFATRVQPVLMNTCISCHGLGKGGSFQLVRSADGGNRAVAQSNLNAALEFINFERPVLSPLLTKAVVAHGSATASPLKGRQAPAFQTLQTWVDQLLAGNPHLKEIRQAEAATGTSISAKKDYFNEVFAERVPPPPSLPPAPPAPPIVNDPKKGEIVSRPTPRLDEKQAAPPPLPAVPAPRPSVTPPPPGLRDPFDPAEFNSRPKS